MADMTPTTAFLHAPTTAAKTTLRTAVDTLMTAIDTFATTAASGTTKAQTVAISGTPTGGTYTLTFTGARFITAQTITLAYNASAATIQTAIRALLGEGFSLTTVTASGSTPNFTHTITFFGNHEDIVVTRSIAGLTGGTPVMTITVTSAYAAIPEFGTSVRDQFKQKLVDWCEELSSSLRV